MNYFSVQFTMEGLKLRLDNLFEGVKVLGEFLSIKNENSFQARLNGLNLTHDFWSVNQSTRVFTFARIFTQTINKSIHHRQ